MAIKASASITLIRVDDLEGVDFGGRNYVRNKFGAESITSNGLTVEFLDGAFRIHGTATKTDANWGLGGTWFNAEDFYEPGQTYTLSTTPALPYGLYLGNNTRNSENGNQMGAGTHAYLYGPNKSTTFEVDSRSDGYVHGFFGVRVDDLPEDNTVDVTFQIKLEKGNVATDWTPAPEDTDQKLDDQKVELQSSIDTAIETSEDGIINTVTETFTTKDDFQTEVGLLQTQLTQTQEDFTFQFNTVNSSLTDLDVFKGEAGTQLDTISKYIRFLNGDILLGGSDSDVQLKIENDRIAFLDNNNEVMYISNEELYIMRAIIATQLTIGNFSWVPRSNGNVSFRYIGG